MCLWSKKEEIILYWLHFNAYLFNFICVYVCVRPFVRHVRNILYRLRSATISIFVNVDFNNNSIIIYSKRCVFIHCSIRAYHSSERVSERVTVCVCMNQQRWKECTVCYIYTYIHMPFGDRHRIAWLCFAVAHFNVYASVFFIFLTLHSLCRNLIFLLFFFLSFFFVLSRS